MKNFKRKLARLFRLALRSDLEKINEAYKKRDEDAKKYLKEIMILINPDSPFIEVEEIKFYYKFMKDTENLAVFGTTGTFSGKRIFEIKVND